MPSTRTSKDLLLVTLQAALERGLLPDDETLKQLALNPELPIGGRDIHSLAWPEDPLRFVLISEPINIPQIVVPDVINWIMSSQKAQRGSI